MGWYTDDTVEFSIDHNAIVDGIKGNGVISGCVVTEQGTPDNTVDVAGGVVIANGTRVAVVNVHKTCVPHATLPLRAIISVSSAGVVTITHGTQAAAAPVGETGPHCSAPAPPAIPANEVILADIWVEANVVPGNVVIHTADITDRRIMIPDDAAAALAAAVLLGGISDAEVAKAPVHHEVFQALALKAPSSGIALTALANQANLTLDGNISGGAAAPSALTAIQVLNTFLMSIAVADLGTKGAEEVTVDWTLGYNKIVTVNGAADFHMTDPGCTGAPKLSMKITKDNSVTIRTPTFTGAATVVWSGGSSPALDVANGVYEITFHRWTANNYTASWSRFY
jgi:hypothetical protein